MKKIPINIWDDYDDEVPNETYAYVEDHKMDYDLRYKHLEEFSVLFVEAIKGSSIGTELINYNSKSRYPNLDEMFHFTRPELRIKNMDHEQREALVQHFKTIESNFDVYSES